jgi:hypothetical protein
VGVGTLTPNYNMTMTSEKLNEKMSATTPPILPRKLKIEIPKLNFSMIHHEDPKKLQEDLKMQRALKEQLLHENTTLKLDKNERFKKMQKKPNDIADVEYEKDK